MKDKIQSQFVIQSGRISYLSNNFESDIQKFKIDNEGKTGEVIFEIEKNSVMFHQHKWYRGFLLPPVAREAYNNLLFKAHLELKKMFLFREVKEWGEIPKKYQSKCYPVVRSVVNTDTGEILEDVICGYLPSTADLNYEEMKEFILNVENFINENLQIGWSQGDAGYRERAFKE